MGKERKRGPFIPGGGNAQELIGFYLCIAFLIQHEKLNYQLTTFHVKLFCTRYIHILFKIYVSLPLINNAAFSLVVLPSFLSLHSKSSKMRSLLFLPLLFVSSTCNTDSCFPVFHGCIGDATTQMVQGMANQDSRRLTQV